MPRLLAQNYFRAKLADSNGSELDAMLERTILLFDEVSGNPVLLSMLALIFSDGSDSKPLPDSLLQLYCMATREAVQRRLAPADESVLAPAGESGQKQGSSLTSNLAVEPVLRMLSRVAVASQLSGNENLREFTGSLVEEAISKDELVMWNSMLAEPRGLPLVKIIEAANGGASSFQFTHLSFQEGMFAQALADGSAVASMQRLGGVQWLDGGNARSLLVKPAFVQALKIGGLDIAVALGLGGDEIKVSTVEELDVLNQLQWAPLGSNRKALTLRLPELLRGPQKVEVMQQLAKYINSSLALSDLE